MFRVEPSDKAKGIIARAYLFMQQRYGYQMGKSQERLFNALNKRFKPSAWEIKWAKQVAKIEGYENSFITSWGKEKD